MAELLELGVAAAAQQIAAAEFSAAEYFAAWREAAAMDRLNAYLWLAEEETAAGEGALGGIPIAVKDIFCTQGVPSTAASKILEGYRPPYTATAVRQPWSGWGTAVRQDQHGRVRDGLLDRELRLRADPQPLGRDARAGRLLGRLGGGGRGRARAAGARHRHRRLDPPAGGALRRRRAQADLRPRLALRPDRLRLLARPDRARSPATSRDAALLLGGHRGPRPARLDLGRRSPAPIDAAEPAKTCAGPAHRRARRNTSARRRSTPRCAAAFEAAIAADRAARRRDPPRSRCRTPSTASAAYYSSPRPSPPPTSPATTACATGSASTAPSDDLIDDVRRRPAPRASAPR